MNPGLYAGVFITALLITLAYQARPSYNIQIGTPPDAPLLSGFNTREVSGGAEPVPFRWTTGKSTMTFRAVGRQDLRVSMLINGWRPPDQPPAHLTITSGGMTFFDGPPTSEPKEYAFVVPREAVRDGTLTLELTTNPFVPTGDPNPRPLGVSVQRVQVSPGSNPDLFIEPPLEVLLPMLALAVALGLFFALSGWGAGIAALGASIPGILGGWLLIFDRLWLTSEGWHAVWLWAALLGLLLALLVGILLKIFPPQRRRVRRDSLGKHVSRFTFHASNRLPYVLLALVLLAFIVRLSGQMHPQICIIDLNFHLHRFETVEAGQLLFRINSAEWGGRETFYLPTSYLFMLPLNWLFNDPLFVIRLFTVAISTLGALPLYYIASRALKDGRAGVIAAALYLTLPIAVLPFSWGITTNLFGEFFALCSLAIVVGVGRDLRPNRLAFWVLVATLLLTLLSHPGVLFLTPVAFTLIALVGLFRKNRQGITHHRSEARSRITLPVFGALALAAVAAYLLYYRHFLSDTLATLEEIRRERAARTPLPGEGIGVRVGGSVGDKSLGLVVRFAQSRSDWLFGGLRGFWQEAQAYYHVWPVAGALVGFLGTLPRMSLAGMRGSESRAYLLRSVSGWALAAALFALVGWVINLYVRYSLFMLPVIALGSGILLSRLWARGRVGALLVALVLAFFSFEALDLWQQRINLTAICVRQ